MNLGYLITGMVVMSLTTYLIRVTPMVVFRKKITNRFVRSFLYYVPYAVLAAMTFPAILSATDHLLSGAVGLAGSVLLAFLHPFRQFDRFFMAPLMPGFAFLRSFPVRIG